MNGVVWIGFGEDLKELSKVRNLVEFFNEFGIGVNP
jgi:hypothetical protein